MALEHGKRFPSCTASCESSAPAPLSATSQLTPTRATPWHTRSAGYLCNGYGGSTLRNLILGLPPSLVTSVDTPWYWLVCSLLVYYSPGDLVFKACEQRGSPVRALVLFGEAVDSATTLCGSYEKGLQLHPKSAAAPLVAAAAAALGGSLFRYVERWRSLDPKQGVEWA